MKEVLAEFSFREVFVKSDADGILRVRQEDLLELAASTLDHRQYRIVCWHARWTIQAYNQREQYDFGS